MVYHSCIKTFLNTLFFTGISPYFYREPTDSEIKASKWTIHQLLCVATIVLNVIADIANVRGAADKKVSNPKELFEFCWSLVAVILHCVFYWTLWTNSKCFENSIRTCQALWSRDRETWKASLVRVAAICFCGFNVLLSLLVAFGKFGGLQEKVPWTPENVIKSHILSGKYKFFASKNSTITLEDLQRYQIAPGDHAFGLVNAIIDFYAHMVYHFIDVGLLSAAVVLWTATYNFHKKYVVDQPIEWENSLPDKNPLLSINYCKIKSQERYPLTRKRRKCMRGRFNPNQVTPMSEVNSVNTISETVAIQHTNTRSNQLAPMLTLASRSQSVEFDRLEKDYNIVRKLSDELNTAFGGVTFFYVLETTLFYSTGFEALFSSTTYTWADTTLVIYFLISCCFIFGFGVDVCRRIKEFKVWICTKQRLTHEYPKDKVQELVQELDCKIIGLSGMGVFLVGANIVCFIVSTIMTYFLLIIKEEITMK